MTAPVSTTPTMEHRLGTRVPLYLPVRLAQRGRALAFGHMLDVSLSGARIATVQSFAPLSRITVVYGNSRPDRADGSQINAGIARVTVNGVGVEWCEFAPAAICRLAALAPAWFSHPAT